MSQLLRPIETISGGVDHKTIARETPDDSQFVSVADTAEFQLTSAADTLASRAYQLRYRLRHLEAPTIPPSVPAWQFARPASDISVGSWVDTTFGDSDGALWDELDEEHPDNWASAASRVSLAAGSTDEFTVKLGGIQSPGTGATHQVKLRYLWIDAATPGATPWYDMTIQLRQGASTVIASTVVSNAANRLWHDVTLTLSAAESANITDYADLRVRVHFDNRTDESTSIAISVHVTRIVLEVKHKSARATLIEPLDRNLIDGVRAFKWTASGSGTNEYYLTDASSNEPNLDEPYRVVEDHAGLAAGTPGSLAAGEFGWGDNDSLGFNTVYVRLSDNANPSNKSQHFLRSEHERFRAVSPRHALSNEFRSFGFALTRDQTNTVKDHRKLRVRIRVEPDEQLAEVYALPRSTVSAGSWTSTYTSVHQSVDERPPHNSDTSRAQETTGVGAATSTFEIKLGDLSDKPAGGVWRLSVAAKWTGTVDGQATVALKVGGSTVFSDTGTFRAGANSVYKEESRQLTDAEVASILASPNDVRVTFQGTSTISGSAATWSVSSVRLAVEMDEGLVNEAA